MTFRACQFRPNNVRCLVSIKSTILQICQNTLVIFIIRWRILNLNETHFTIQILCICYSLFGFSVNLLSVGSVRCCCCCSRFPGQNWTESSRSSAVMNVFFYLHARWHVAAVIPEFKLMIAFNNKLLCCVHQLLCFWLSDN